MLDYVSSIRSNSTRFGQLLRTTDPAAPVPSCPGWSASDLFWHLTEVQHFWATIVEGLLAGPESVPELPRPSDASVGDVFGSQSERLAAALQHRKPADQCWSWHHAGHTVGWVRRRQAHEALIHRVDADLVTGNKPQLDAELAGDGIDEILTVMLDAADLPAWATFTPDGASARIATERGDSWTMLLGRFTGTSPATGNTYNDPALRLGEVSQPSVVIEGTAADLDLWLWGRGPSEVLDVTGDPDLAALVRAAAAAGTQ